MDVAFPYMFTILLKDKNTLIWQDDIK